MTMRYLTFMEPEQSSYEICFLVPQLQANEIARHYIAPHLQGMEQDLLAYDLHKGPKVTPVKEQREYLGKLLPTLQTLGVKYLVVCDGEYFKTLTKAKSSEAAAGYMLPSAAVKEAGLIGGEFQVVFCPNFRSVFYNPEKVQAEIRTALQALKNHRSQTYTDPGLDVIKFAAYPSTLPAIRSWLERLLDMECDLGADIEAFSLKHYDAGIATISLAWNKHEGIAFAVDLLPNLQDRILVRSWLKTFFEELHRRGHKLIWHNIAYDVTVVIYQLWMSDLLDTEGLLTGMGFMLTHWDCTKLITYLATNSCAGNRLGLKYQAQEFAGDYGLDDEEFKDISKVPLDELLQYNLIDSLSTWHVYEKHWPTVVADNQEQVYTTHFKVWMLDIIQMQLTGMPLDMEAVVKLDTEFRDISEKAVARMCANPAVQKLVAAANIDWVTKKNNTLKVKRVSILDAKESFNPNSTPQLQRLLFDPSHMGLPVFDYTDTKQPSTGADTLEKLVNHTKDPIILEFLEALIEYKSLDKLITSFLPAMLAAPMGPDGWHYLFGSFNLGGTISGRLSSSGPNLQNIPAKGKTKLKKQLSKKIKMCFAAPPGWLFVGLDFAALEDKISALTTRDPNKLKVYTDGYDGHCLRAHSYFGDRMPNIDPTSVKSINSIEKLYEVERQDSKVPTFLLTYGGTFIGIMQQCGWDEKKARLVEDKYHEMYRVSDEWVAARIEEAGHNGYVEVAFGLRLRTPLLHQVILGTSRTPFEAQAEGRSAGNALGQSWCMLTNRASAEFMAKVRSSKYRLSIKPCAHIHDAQYCLIKDSMEELLYTNEHMVTAVKWQDDPLIADDQVKLGGELSIFHPNWACEMDIPNEASSEDIMGLAFKHHLKYCN